ncbi:helix-turn-helix domain-containing protein, partial [Streptosporangium sp. KLBMP 9127]|nr:helix-turn-helix transcriptional regulator [Streptosporangium sp. KLBMP 9127]
RVTVANSSFVRPVLPAAGSPLDVPWLLDGKSTGKRETTGPPNGPLIPPLDPPPGGNPPMADKIPNAQLQRWREQRNLSREKLAQMLNQSESGIAGRLACDEERIRRWEKGEVSWPRDPYPAALEEVTGLRPEALGFGRSKGPAVLTMSTGPFIREPAPEIDEIADIAEWLNRGSHRAAAIDEIEQATASMANAHTVVPPKNLLRHVMRVHRQVQSHLKQGDLRFRQVRELLRIDADLIAHAAVLLGDINRDQAAEAYGRLAVQLAQEADSNQGFAWYARAKTARWQGSYVEAADLARRGYNATPAGPMRHQLAWYEANAAALFGDTSRALDAVKRAYLAADSPATITPDRSVWAFPVQRQTLFSLAVAVRTGDPDEALRTASTADQAAAAGDRPALANWAQIRAAAGLAHLLKDDLSGVIHEVTPVLTMPPELRVTTVTGYLDDLARSLAQPRFADSGDAVRLRQQIREFNAAALPDEPHLEGE